MSTADILLYELATLRMEVAQVKRMIRKQGRQIMAALDDLEAELTRNTSTVDSTLTLVTRLLSEIEAAKMDPARVQAVVDKFRANDDRLAAAVDANTPAGPVVPPPA